ncbi:UTP--glucose-1-phosphate uridylyltransferase GalU [Rossellomorea vietnamensis]|uniref:UTP--glucose-1-phosphate uridylyltransferase GalU n=1 Tax=Rossellomorea vietnamensis TaxID=218284 RepID=UPI001CC96F63|nr:UTP--glucose-1-phosphate uridylyltransferase GalU [Rossellomorea vietnamensis]MCA0150338.1 UTP--glucose-1-phosphate uridylyltransferase GalU [Rossellomorea vietnamensis]
MRVKKAIIPAAGLGTRFLPATKAQPKEMLPIVDKPTIQYIIEEAVNSGIEDILIVTGRGKRAIEDHFDKSLELEEMLAMKEKYDELEQIKQISNLADIHYIRQKEPKGLGHAIWCARKFIGDDPFAVLLGDDIVISEKPCLKQLIDEFEEKESSIIGVQEVPDEDVSKYGVIDVEDPTNDGPLFKVKGLVEKPKLEDAPSNMAIMGRYVLTPDVLEILGNQEPGQGNEIQLTDALQKLNEQQNVYGYSFDGKRYDIGNKYGFVQATVEFALMRDDLKGPLKDWLKDIISE